MIIVLEGFDQAGKKTQTHLLAKALKARKLKYKIFSFPAYSTPTGKQIKYYLSGKRKFQPQVIHSLLAANRREKLNEIKTVLSKNYIILMNRYYQSNLVYGLANGLDLKWLLSLDEGLPKEDLVLLLDVNPKDSFVRKKVGRDKFERDKEFAYKIIHNYRILAKKYGWKIINAAENKEQVHKSIMKVVSKYLR